MTKTSKRSGKTAVQPMQSSIARFTSRGAAGGSSTGLGNYVLTLDEAGNPFTGSQQGKYGLTVAAIAPLRYFATNLFAAYDYYRIVDCETTISYTTTPTNGVCVAAEMMYVLDKDSRDNVSLTSVANRSELQTRTFNNCCLRHVIHWKPYLIENSQTFGEAGSQVDYVQPRSRWLNTDLVESHRFGALRLIGAAWSGSNGYPSNDPTLEIRHRVVVEMKGLRSVQPNPSFTEVFSF